MDLAKQLEKAVKEIEKKAKEAVEGNYKLEEVMDSDFIQNNSKFSSLSALIEEAPIQLTVDNFTNLDDEDLNLFIEENTDFKTWLEMLHSAKKQFGLKLLKEKGFNVR